jgi:hypothetical protein
VAARRLTICTFLLTGAAAAAMVLAQLAASTPTRAGARFAAQPGYRIRGGWLGAEDIRLVEPAAQAGIDTLLVAFFRLRVPLNGALREQLVQWATTCRRHGIDFWPTFGYLTEFEPGWVGPYRQYVSGNGVRARHTPCPLDADFWRRTVEARCLLLADLSRQYPITGVVLDAEMYGADKPAFVDVCYCGDCVARTLQEAGRDPSPPYPDARRQWLTDIGLLEQHFAMARRGVQQLADQTRARVGAIAPDLLLGALAIDMPQPVAEGMLLGFGRPERPVYDFSESTYVAGYTNYVPQAQARMERLGAYARMVCGVWQTKFLARTLPAHLYECARNSAGHWIYTLADFNKPDSGPLPGNPVDYWAAIRRANDELDQLARDPDYQTSLTIEPFVLPPKPVTARGVARLDLVPLAPPTGQAVPPAQLRNSNILYLYRAAGRQATLSLRLVSIANIRDGGQYLVISPDGQALTRGDLLEFDKPLDVELPGEQAGLHALVLGAGSNVIRVEGHQPYAITASSTSPARLFIVIPTLYLLANAGQREVVLQMGVGGEAERVRAVVTQNDRVRFDGVLTDTRKVALPIDPAAAQRILKIDVQRVPGAVRESFSVAVLSGAYPFVAVSPEGLLRE